MTGTGSVPLLQVQDVRVFVRDTDRTIVRDLSFVLERGQTLGIVGESGSGKSMTAKTIAALLPAGVAASGTVRLDGLDLLASTKPQVEQIRGRRVSLLMQDPFTMLNPVQTIGATIRESLAPLRRSGSELRSEVERRLAEVGISPELTSKYPFQLSGGQLQRVAIAAALAKDPDLLLADEPTTALDVTTQAEVLTLLRRLQADRGMALLLITHDLQVAFAMCDDIQIMYAGTVLEFAPTTAIESEPLHPYTSGLLNAEVPADRYAQKLDSIPGSVPPADSVLHSCPFAARCEWVREECRSAAPPLRTIESHHDTACIRIEDIRGDLRRRIETDTAAIRPIPVVEDVVLRVDSLEKAYHVGNLLGRSKTSVALRGVSFEIGRGESVGLVGESGSGKTTIARSILGLVAPSAGTIHLGETDISDFSRLDRKRLRAVRQRLQIVFQDPYASLNPSLRVGDALREALGHRSAVEDGVELTVDRVLEMVGLPPAYASRRPSQLSGGERQRVSIARAVAVQPELLICDEPVAALDVSVQAQVLELLRRIRREYGMSMLFITHDLAVVRQMTDRIVVLYRGQIVEQGTTEQIIDDPQHPYTKRLVNSVASNLARQHEAELSAVRPETRMPV
jgi:peptide/nickel transport system ATP-binding protein